MTDITQKKENIKILLKDLRVDLKKMHLSVTKELLIPQPDEVKALMYKMDKLLKAIDQNKLWFIISKCIVIRNLKLDEKLHKNNSTSFTFDIVVFL